MLAWVHQAIAAECEFLESLFGLGGEQEGDGQAGRMVGAVRTFRGSEEEGWVKELLNSAVTKLCVPLKVCLSRYTVLWVLHVFTGTRAADCAFARK